MISVGFGWCNITVKAKMVKGSNPLEWVYLVQFVHYDEERQKSGPTVFRWI
jgi:hypothetical protein